MAQKAGAERRQQRIVGLDGGDGAPLGAGGGREAGANRRAIQQHGAGAAITGIATDLGAGQPRLLPQRIRQASGGADEGDRLAVDAAHATASIIARRVSSAAASSR